MSEIQNSFICPSLIECELNDKFRRKEIVKKIKSEKNPVLEIEISCLKYYNKLEEHLSEILSTNPNSISTLNIILNEIQLSEKIYLIIAQSISKFKHLKELSIELCSVKLKDQQIKQIVYEIVDLDMLKSLSIDISNNNLITNDISQYFGLTISQLSKLQKLSLSIGGCSKIEDEFIQKYAQLTRKAISLEDVSLHLSDTKIKAFNFLKNICEIQNLKSLSITYNFSSVEAEQSFLENLNIFNTKIKSLSLYFQGSHFQQVRQNSDEYFFMNLGKILNNFTKLKELFLNCENQKQKIDLIPFYKSMSDKIIEGVSIYLNTDNEKENSQLKLLAQESSQQLLRFVILDKIQKYFKHYTQLLC
ncbi:hypothetical protein ABPG72_004492 [Tetrahymena utriculariae]